MSRFVIKPRTAVERQIWRALHRLEAGCRHLRARERILKATVADNADTIRRITGQKPA